MDAHTPSASRSPGREPHTLGETIAADLLALSALQADPADGLLTGGELTPPSATLTAESADIRARWNESHRSYHDLTHLSEVLQAIDTLAPPMGLSPQDRLIVRAAAHYHDVVYDPRSQAGSNEHRSAAIARDHLHVLSVHPSLIDAVESLILMTADHTQHGADGMAGMEASDDPTAAMAVFHDADLWILAAPPQRFDDYCAQVRREYAHVPSAAYAQGRSTILQSLTRAEIYATQHAREHWQEWARANVARELDRLASDAPS